MLKFNEAKKLWWLWVLLGLMVAGAVVAALLLWPNGDKETTNADKTYKLYWNVERANYVALGMSGATSRMPSSDGYYYMKMAVDGQQERFKVQDYTLVNQMEFMELMCLEFDENGETYVSYYLNKEQTAHAATRDFWVDNSEDIIFVKDDIVIDTVPLAEIPAYMEEISVAENHCFHYVLVHEQYFYEDYPRYEPDYRERVFATVDWCHRHGYRPVKMSDVIFEDQLATLPNG